MFNIPWLLPGINHIPIIINHIPSITHITGYNQVNFNEHQILYYKIQNIMYEIFLHKITHNNYIFSRKFRHIFWYIFWKFKAKYKWDTLS